MAFPPRATPALRLFVLLLLAGFLAALIAWLNRPGSDLEAYRQAGLPFGCIPAPHQGYAVQDFAYNLHYFRGIQDRLVAHPYRQGDQEQIIRHALPTATSGMCHAYSPVAYLLAQPFLLLSPPRAYLAYSILAALGFVLLYALDLLPRARGLFQVCLLIVCLLNITVATAFAVGQTALLTTPALAAFWYFLKNRPRRFLGATDLLLALLFWALCLKPSIAMIPLILLLGARAWSALAAAGGLLTLTWALLGPRYGGWWDGLRDYTYLLNHYYEAAMSPFMREVFSRHGDTGANAYFSTLFPGHSAPFFTLSRVLFLAANLILLVLRLRGRITLSLLFRGMIWNFLLLCPYLLPSEDCIFCLLIVEGAFFRPAGLLANAAKLLLVLAILNLRVGLTFPTQINFPLKCLLLAWMILDAFSISGERNVPQEV